MSLQTALGRFLIYAILIIGAVIMVFPFYWMISTSLQTRQEAGQAEPILVPQKMHPGNWAAAWSMGREGTGGTLAGALTGGWHPGGSLEFEVTVAETEAGAGFDVVVPRPAGVLSFPLGEQTAAEVRPLERDGPLQTYVVRLEHTGDTEFSRLPLQLRIPRTSTYESS